MTVSRGTVGWSAVATPRSFVTMANRAGHRQHRPQGLTL
jgi:hypothetical protein